MEKWENCRIEKGLIERIKEVYEEARNGKSREEGIRRVLDRNWTKVAHLVRLCLQYIYSGN